VFGCRRSGGNSLPGGGVGLVLWCDGGESVFAGGVDVGSYILGYRRMMKMFFVLGDFGGIGNGGGFFFFFFVGVFFFYAGGGYGFGFFWVVGWGGSEGGCIGGGCVIG